MEANRSPPMNTANIGHQGQPIVENDKSLQFLDSALPYQPPTMWIPSPTSMEVVVPPYSPTVPMPNENGLNQQHAMSGPATLYSTAVPLMITRPPPHMSFSDMAMPAVSTQMQSLSIPCQSQNTTMPPFMSDIKPSNVAPYYPPQSQSPTTPDLFPSPSTINSALPSRQAPGSPCTCFADCTQSLQALYNTSQATSIDLTTAFSLSITTNRIAVAACGAMLACPKCFNGTAPDTFITMLLATVLGQVGSSYKNIFGPIYEANMMGVAPSCNMGAFDGGVPSLLGDDFGLGSLSEGMMKYAEICSEFRSKIFVDASVNTEMMRSLLNYIDLSAHSIFQLVLQTKNEGGMGSSMTLGQVTCQ
ncbi:hypothetical protein NUW58_g7748 [Xylaria curta]|uniref:Uncharacterized protein n=1 Tax=Xylaria curta TaxID=42375 RepID=A0ACC1NFF5_9PEZI|nr:hypothetical protein NUW58_g7748 [Xylaria curta]